MDIKFNWAKLIRALELGVLFGVVCFLFTTEAGFSWLLGLLIVYLEFFYKRD